jgi:hypothetical protein
MAQITLNSTGVASSGALALQSNGTTTAVTIDASQNVGIGTASPAQRLHIAQAGQPKIEFEDTTNSSKGRITTGGSTGSMTFDADPDNAKAGSVMTFNVDASERARIDSSGNVGIGASSPLTRLDVVVSGTGDQNILSLRTTGGGGQGLLLGVNTTNSVTTIKNNTGAYGMAFYSGTGTSESMRLDSSGNLLVGTTAENPVSARVNGSVLMPGGGLRIRATSGATAWGVNVSSGQHITWYTDNGSTFVTAGAISSNGSTTTYGTGSDYRMKTDVQPMVGALSKVLQLNPVTYKWKPEFAGTNENSQGFIAHELQEVVPECVTGEKDAVDADGNSQYQGIDTSFLVATLTAAIQEQQAIITQLQADVAALKGTA